LAFTQAITGTSGSITLTDNSTVTYTVTEVGGDGIVTDYGAYGQPQSYWIGATSQNVDDKLLVTFSAPVSGIQIQTQASASSEEIAFTIDGTSVNLSTLISNGDASVTEGATAEGANFGGGNGFVIFNIPITTILFDHNDLSSGTVLTLHANDTPICFVSGTFIKTQSGERPVEELSAGDMVLTMDHGYQPIRWIGSSKRPATGDLAPILIRKGALGNTRDLRVSPQHRMLLSGWQAEVLFGEREVLATAKSLVNDYSILREEGGEVEYFHMLFDTHEIVYAEGAPSESFHPGAEGWKALDMPTRNEILELFPQLANGNFDSYGPSARASLKYKEGSLLSHSMISQTQH